MGVTTHCLAGNLQAFTMCSVQDCTLHLFGLIFFSGFLLQNKLFIAGHLY